MEDIRRVTKAEYANVSDEDKTELESKFQSMDKDGDGKISLHEFREHSNLYTNSFFSLLDRHRDGFLQFEEFLILNYITKSGRPFCAACKDFIPTSFFTCRQCRLSPTNNNNNNTSYDLCIKCYHEGKKSDHNHDEFDDNCTLLLTLQRMLLSADQPRQANPSRSGRSSPSRPKTKASDKSGGSRRARLKATMKKMGRKILQVMSWISSILGFIFTVHDLANGGGGGGGDDGKDDDNGGDGGKDDDNGGDGGKDDYYDGGDERNDNAAAVPNDDSRRS